MSNLCIKSSGLINRFFIILVNIKHTLLSKKLILQTRSNYCYFTFYIIINKYINILFFILQNKNGYIFKI